MSRLSYLSMNTTPYLFTRGALILFSVTSCSSSSLTAFSHSRVHGPRYGCRLNSRFSVSFPLPPSPSELKHILWSSTSIYSSRRSQPSIDSFGLDVEEKYHSYPVQIHHQGHVVTINVREHEPILQALERQSTVSNKISCDHESHNDGLGGSSDIARHKSSLALSHIPHECRRGNCLTCSSRILTPRDSQNNILPNVDNGLSPTVASELTKSGYILTCCSYVTGPGVVLELDQNEEVWDAVYRKRICNKDSEQVAMEAQARLLRRVDEENVGNWKRRIEENWETSENDVE